MIPETGSAPSDSGLAPLGSLYEVGSQDNHFPYRTRSESAFGEVSSLYAQAVNAQWSAERDIPWSSAKPISPRLDWAVTQVMTFLSENELSALYLPSRFVSQIHPFFVESSQFLATQIIDESRHIEVFLRRARLSGKYRGVSSVVTAQSLLSLLAARDFLESSFLLSVLGEGTFVDLLTYLEKNAPDEVTRTIVTLARNDEARHVHFGMSHVREAILRDSSVVRRLREAVERRNHSLSSLTGAPDLLQDSLVVLGAGSDLVADIPKGYRKYQELLETMELNRVRRLQSAGFSETEAKEISKLHTPNFM